MENGTLQYEFPFIKGTFSTCIYLEKKYPPKELTCNISFFQRQSWVDDCPFPQVICDRSLEGRNPWPCGILSLLATPGLLGTCSSGRVAKHLVGELLVAKDPLERTIGNTRNHHLNLTEKWGCRSAPLLGKNMSKPSCGWQLSTPSYSQSI